MVSVTQKMGYEVMDHRYIFVGERVASMYGDDLTGDSVMSLADSLSSKYFEVSKNGEPIIDENHFTNLHNAEVRYRQILLPLGPDDETVSHILGGMRYKLFGKEL